MNCIDLKRISYLSIIIIFGLLGTRCAATKEELHAHGDMASVKTYPKDYLHPITEVNFEKMVNENRGLKILEENATTVHDYYRGAVQEKAEGEKFFKESKWGEAEAHLEKSNRFLRVVLRYLPEDEAYRNIYGEQVVIFLPNLLIADNDLKLVTVYKNLKNDDKTAQAKAEGQQYLTESLKSVKTEWAYQIKKGFEDTLQKKA